ncbi:MAG: DNA polymerase III subunit delta [Pseudomonadota bacterium]
MKIAPSQIDRWLKNPDPKVRLILLFGPDQGLSAARLNELAAQLSPDLDDPFQVVRFDGAQLAAHPALLAEACQTLAPDGSSRLILAQHCKDDSTKAFRTMLDLDHERTTSITIARSDDLPVRSKLRMLASDHPHAAAIGCYSDSRRLHHRMDQAFAAEQITLAHDAKRIMQQALGGCGEMEGKLLIEICCLYAGPGGQLSARDILACLNDPTVIQLDQLVLKATSADPHDPSARSLEQALDTAWQSGLQPVHIMRGLGNHLIRLWQVVTAVKNGLGRDAAMKGLRPPVFFKQADQFRRQLSVWDQRKLLKALQLVQETDRALRKTAMPNRALAGSCLHRIAYLARSGVSKGIRQ